MNAFREFWQSMNPRAWHALMHCLKDLEPGEDFDTIYRLKPPIKEIDEDRIPLPYMVYLTLVVLLGFPHWGREEKTAWSIPVTYKGVPFLIAHRKFGLRVDMPNSDQSTQELAGELLLRPGRAAQIADRFLQLPISQQVANANVTVVNRYYLFHERYIFFREKAGTAFHSPPPDPIVLRRDETGQPVVTEHDPLQPQKEGFYYTQAMLDAYFNYLEHLLVLLLVFAGFDPANDNVGQFMSADWTTKYNRIFDPDFHPDAKRLYNRLQEIKERIRNTFSHGGFEKQGASLFVHLPGVGATPVQLSKFKGSVNYRLIPVRVKDFEQIYELLDTFEQYIAITRFSRALRIIQAGLNVRFDEKARQRYAAAITSDEETESFIEQENYWYMINANMDW